MPQDLASNVAMALEALLAILPFFGIALLNIWLARRGWPPLSQLVEDNLRRYPLVAAGLSGFVGALVGHVFWSFGDNPSAQPARFLLFLLAIAVAVLAGALGALVLGVLAYAVNPVVTRVGRRA